MFPVIDPAIGRTVLECVRGCTFDDYILAPQRSVLSRRDPAAIDLSGRLSRRITLKRPIVSANMDTVTRAPMAIVQAEEGGIGIIDRGFRPGEIEPQVREVEIVKRTQHGVINDPYSIDESASVGEAMTVMARSRVGTLVVVDGERRLRGLLTERDVRFVNDRGASVSARMTPLDRLVVHQGLLEPLDAERIMAERKVKKLPLVDKQGRLIGLITSRDLMHQRRLPFATRDEQGRLRVGAAIGATGDYLERAAELVRAGVDILVIDIAHGHSVVMEKAMREFRKRFSDVEMIAGNVATADGARFLLEQGADGIKVGIGPGGGCTTRMTTSFGVPQLQALVECRLAIGDSGVPVIADGGIKRHGSLAEALVFGGDCAMLGSAFAGTEEAPGEIVHKSVVLPESQKAVKVPFKVLRGMASIEAIRDRLDVEDADSVELEAIGAEGMEISVPARGSARTILREMMKHLCSSISYGGASSLGELRTMFWAEPEKVLDTTVAVVTTRILRALEASESTLRHARNGAPRAWTMPLTATAISRTLRSRANPASVAILQSFFKTGPGEYGEGDRFIGAKVPVIRAVCRECRGASLAEIQKLLRSPIHEERALALLMLCDAFTAGDHALRRRIYDLYLANTAFINNWDLVDCSAAQIVGGWLRGRSTALLTRLARSKSLWERRIAMIATFDGIRRGEFDETFRIADLLLHDDHDLIHKAVGWLLREVGKRDGAAERAFLAGRYKSMPRTMLRYAIERFPEVERRRYLKGEV